MYVYFHPQQEGYPPPGHDLGCLCYIDLWVEPMKWVEGA